jgi:hypothetical protein
MRRLSLPLLFALTNIGRTASQLTLLKECEQVMGGQA